MTFIRFIDINKWITNEFDKDLNRYRLIYIYQSKRNTSFY